MRPDTTASHWRALSSHSERMGAQWCLLSATDIGALLRRSNAAKIGRRGHSSCASTQQLSSLTSIITTSCRCTYRRSADQFLHLAETELFWASYKTKVRPPAQGHEDKYIKAPLLQKCPMLPRDQDCTTARLLVLDLLSKDAELKKRPWEVPQHDADPSVPLGKSKLMTNRFISVVS